VSDPSSRDTSLISLSGRRPDAALQALAPIYDGAGWDCRPTDAAFWFRYVAIGDDQLSVRRLQMHGHLRGTASTGSDVVVHWLERGHARVQTAKDVTRLQPGAPPTMLPREGRFEFEYEDWDQRLIHLSKALLLEVAEEQNVVTTSAFDRRATPEVVARTQWQRSLGLAVEAFRVHGAESEAWADARREVARALLVLHPSSGERLLDRRSARDDRIRAALDYVLNHAHEAITVDDIADAASLSVRGVQEAFKREFQRSPMAFVRETRLDRAHAELQAFGVERGAVAEIARRSGFSHMGRFSATYHERFGEYPRDTLRSSAP
jgi:AraC-like DNA-binding protein